MKNAFARDEHGNIKRKQGCQTPGCSWPNWHVCLLGKPNRFGDAITRLNERLGKNRRPSSLSMEHREAISEAQRLRWARIKAGAR